MGNRPRVERSRQGREDHTWLRGQRSGGRTFASWDIFVRDRSAGTTKLVSVSIHGGQHVIATSSHPAISADGRFIAFDSDATNLVADDKDNRDDVFVRDRAAATTTLVSVGRARH
jgi:Tol biopolymer transport system component